jgi:peptidoglycan hydrolase-like protein with peptidoglycan-binding domain
VQVRHGELWPLRRLPSGERLTVTLTVRRPGWAGWLIGKYERRAFTVVTPNAHLRGHWLQAKAGLAVTVAFDAPVTRVQLGHRVRVLPRARSVVQVGVVAEGPHAAGSIEVAAAARSWELLPAPEKVTWFPAQPYPQLLVAPKPGSTLAPDHQITLTLSSPVADVLGSRRPSFTRAVPGSWRLLDDHTLTFRPSGLGFALGEDVTVELPRAVALAGRPSAALTRAVSWQVPAASTLRLQQLLAQLGYLPLDWQPADSAAPSTVRAQLAAAIEPPAGRFTWSYPNTPPELQSLWHAGQPNQITRGAVMMFEHDHGLAVDAIAGPHVWRALLTDVLAGKRRDAGYSYVYVHRNVPQSLNLWHNGSTILTSPGNTGVPAAPTTLGTFPVFEHIPVGTMKGRNPDGSRYNDPGIRWISYFHGGDAIHAFNRSSFGTPQSLGCVELPLAAAAKVWPYTPIGTLVTVEN